MDNEKDKERTAEPSESKVEISSPLFLVRRPESDANIVKSDSRYPTIRIVGETGPEKGE